MTSVDLGQKWVVLVAAVLLAGVAAAGAASGGAQMAAAALAGGFGGLALHHASFGFTGAWRRLQRERRGAGVRAQVLLIGLVVVVAYPLIGFGVFQAGWVFPVSVSVAIGAALFGFGMQLGGGCGSGTLYTVGGGSTRMLLTLGAFIAGSVVWTATNGQFQTALSAAWSGLGLAGDGRLGAVSFIRELGAFGALALTLGALGVIWAWSARLERRAHGAVEGLGPVSTPLGGPWSRATGALALAGVVLACFALLGRPWGVTAAFPIWGAQISDTLGLPIVAWGGAQPWMLTADLFADATSVMNFGVMAGALAAAGLAGKFAPVWRLSFRDVATAVVGGLLMGYGARLAFGCNIGGLIGGVASASLHGWSWLLFGALGSVVGVWARAALGMDPPAPRLSGV